MTQHEKRQATALSLVMALLDMMKRAEPLGSFRHRKLNELEVRSCNLVNVWRQLAFDPGDLKKAGAICDMVEEELNRTFPG